MSVIVPKRKLSRYEALIYAETLQKELTDLMLRDFGIKDMNRMLRNQAFAASGCDIRSEEEYRLACRKTAWLFSEIKKRINYLTSLLTANLRAAHSRFPTTLHEYEIRRDCLNGAIVNCEQIKQELQRSVEMFAVDLNVYERSVKAINTEIELIKSWRSRDNKIRVKIKG